MSDKLEQRSRRQAEAHKWGSQLRREIDALVRATEGMGATSLLEALVTEAVIADNGELVDKRGNKGFAWNPEVYARKTVGQSAAARERVKSAGASLGRVLVGGHPDHRTYLAYLQALYVVATQQDYDVTERIELLWDQMVFDEEQEPELDEPARRRSFLGRIWDVFRTWWLGSAGGML